MLAHGIRENVLAGGGALVMWKSLAPTSARAARTSATMSGINKKRRRAASATPWDHIPERDLTPAEAIVAASHKGIYEFRHARFAGDADFFNGHPRDRCPFCEGRTKKNGYAKTGIQKYRRLECGKVSTPTTGTIFDNAKLPVTAWADFILQALSFESISSMTREDRRADTTAPYWMAKLFAVLDGIQDDVVLAGRVFIDEKYCPVAAEDAVHKEDGKLLRGLSRNQIRIAVGVDESNRSIFLREGLGKPGKSRTWTAFGGHIAAQSTLVHDMEHSHSVLANRPALVDRQYNAKTLKGLPDELDPLEPVNRSCYLTSCFLRSHSGFDRDSLQGYLDLLYVAMNPPEDKLEKVAMILDRAMRCPNTVRFRSFYNVKPRSDDSS